MPALKYWLWLTRVRGVKNQSRLALLRQFGTPENIFFADPAAYRLTEGVTAEEAARLADKSLKDADRILGDCDRLDVDIVTIQDAAYPGRLRDTFDPPCVLYVRGRLPVIDAEAVVSVVGTRSCTFYGIACAERLSYGLAAGGAVVASGLARGIDSAAIRGALLAGGVTLGFLGSGVDVPYPRENRDLYEDVAVSGALISEYPPGTKPAPANFPQRNRIMSGCSVAALVVEAPIRSGALITASLALEQGRDVFAVPGPIDAPASAGCNRLIRDGAGLVSDARDILETFAHRFPEIVSGGHRTLAAVVEAPEPLEPAKPVQPEKTEAAEPAEAANPVPPESTEAVPAELPEIEPFAVGLTDDQIDVMRLLDPVEPMSMDDVIERTGIPAKRIFSALTVLEVDGWARDHGGKRYTRLATLKEKRKRKRK